jgi:flotillin
LERLSAVGAAAFLTSRYHTAPSWQLLVKTGLGVTDMVIAKTAVQLPFQQVHRLSLPPLSVPVSVAAMTTERLEFLLPAQLSVGPSPDDESLQRRYARLMLDKSEGDVERMVREVVEGEVRILAAGMSIEAIFADRQAFKDEIEAKVGATLATYGLVIHNSNVRELSDVEGSEYFM